jgi:hypothetical protein
MVQVVTVNQPFVGSEGLYGFKDPFYQYLSQKFGTDINNVILKIEGVTSLKDILVNNNVDPYLDIYQPLGISDIQYRFDASNNVPIVTFLYKRELDQTLFRVPLSFISKIAGDDSILYKQTIVQIDLGNLPSNLDVSVMFNDIANYITSVYGVSNPNITLQYGSGSELVSPIDYASREAIRGNTKTVQETCLVKYNKLLILYNDLRDKYLNLVNKLKTP